MESEFKYLYLCTGFMLLMVILFILLITWVSTKISSQHKFIMHRDKQWAERIEAVEALVRTEFQAVLTELKKL